MIVAVWPKPYSTAFMIHLHQPGYRRGSRGRAVRDTSLCGVTVNEVTPPPVGPLPTGRKHVPMRDAVQYVGNTLPFPHWIEAPKSPYRWCPHCVGIAVFELGLMGSVVEQIMAKQEEEP